MFLLFCFYGRLFFRCHSELTPQTSGALNLEHIWIKTLRLALHHKLMQRIPEIAHGSFAVAQQVPN